ncbi:unnamed protein product [Calicophoron daubneyi]|uniref:G-protein coupled receptors family 1 profile domain-containing protein n=1 Tax=Calicophoron daubneyi TaxID=300641 RepID=A0AAV2TP84_CALDB
MADQVATISILAVLEICPVASALNSPSHENIDVCGLDQKARQFQNVTCDVAKDYLAVKFIIIFLYSLIAFVGLAGNILVVWVVARTKSMQAITNIFIANLALSDILMCLVATPFTPVSLYMKSWTLPEAVCKLLPITMGVSVYVSTLTSMAIALDRFFIIVHPFLPRMKIWLCFVIICTIWVIAILISMPLAVYQQKHRDKDSNIWACQENWPKESSREVFTIVSFVLQFVVPCSIISVCYFRISLILQMRLKSKIASGAKTRLQDENEIKRKKRTNSILIAMVVIFVICWIPLNVLLIAMDVLSEGQTKVVNNSKYFSLIFFVCHLLAMSSAVYNPFLYAWMNENFKKEVRRILPCLFWWSQHVRPPTGQQTVAIEYSAMQTAPDKSVYRARGSLHPPASTPIVSPSFHSAEGYEADISECNPVASTSKPNTIANIEMKKSEDTINARKADE